MVDLPVGLESSRSGLSAAGDTTVRIGMLTDVYRPGVNGVTNSVYLCRRELERLGHRVTVFTFGSAGVEEELPGVIRSPALPISDTGYHFGVALSREARRRVAEMDVLHAHHPFISGRLAIRHGQQLGMPVAFTNHTRYDLYAQAYLQMVPPALTNLVLESYLPSFARLCDLVIAPSEGLKQVLVDLGVTGEIVVIPNGVDLSSFVEVKNPVSRAALKIPQGAVVGVYCGRMSPEKDVGALLDAFAGVTQAVPDAYLLLVGGGGLESEIVRRSTSTPKVRYVGPVEYHEVASYLDVADLFATASVTEVHPLSLIEAMAAGLPVVGVKSPGVGDIVRHGVDGLLSAGGHAGFVAQMTRLYLDRELREKMSISARQRAVEFDIRTTAEALLEWYERLIDQGPHRRPGDKALSIPLEEAW